MKCVYGVNRKKYLPLFEKKLNEIVVGTGITESDWIVNWKLPNVVYATGKKFTYPEYVSGKRVSDFETGADGIVIGKVEAKSPILENQKAMTMHPFLSFENIIDLIIQDHNNTNTFQLSTTLLDDLKTPTANKGILINNIEGEKSYDLNRITLYSYSGYNSGIQITRDLSGIKSPWVDVNNILVNEVFALTAPAEFKISASVYGECFPITIKVKLLNVIVKSPNITLVISHPDVTVESWTQVVIPATGETVTPGTYYYTSPEAEIVITKEQASWTFSMLYDAEVTAPIVSGQIDLSIKLTSAFYNGVGTFEIVDNDSGSTIVPGGRYDCLANLPKISPMEFIQQMLIHTCSFLGYDENGDFKVYFLDEFKANLEAGTVYDWSGKVSNIRKSTFQFNSNAQKNYIKFGNDKDLTDRKATITVSDLTIDSERDLYNLKFDSPLGNVDEMSEYILYEQTVKRSGTDGVSFENKYVGDKWQCAFVEDVAGVATNIDIIGTNYATYQKIIEKPRVIECDVNLGMLESATIDFTKPIYLDYEAGRYAMLLELQAPNNEVCAAKLLLINQTL